VYAEFNLPDGMELILYNGNVYAQFVLGAYGRIYTGDIYNGGMRNCFSNDKSPTVNTTYYSSGAYKNVGFTVTDGANKKRSTPRIRLATSEGNGKIWSISSNQYHQTYDSARIGGFRILLPSCGYEGHNFVGKAIATGDGSTLAFNLPWSDINTSKTYKVYVNGVEKTEGVHYTLSNGTSVTTITFTSGNAPASGAAITGDWWVDYVPKDSDHVFDATFTLVFSEPA
jgi:hypothetical protein